MGEPVSDGVGAVAGLLGLKPLTILGSAVGGFISLNVFDGQTRSMRWTAALSGTLLAMLVAEPVTLWSGIPAKMETPVAIFIAVFGMSLVTAIAKALKEIKFVDVFWGVLGKFGIKKPPTNGQGDGT